MSDMSDARYRMALGLKAQPEPWTRDMYGEWHYFEDVDGEPLCNPPTRPYPKPIELPKHPERRATIPTSRFERTCLGCIGFVIDRHPEAIDDLREYLKREGKL